MSVVETVSLCVSHWVILWARLNVTVSICCQCSGLFSGTAQRLADPLIASQLVGLVLSRAFCHSQGNPGFFPLHHVANLSSSLVL